MYQIKIDSTKLEMGIFRLDPKSSDFAINLKHTSYNGYGFILSTNNSPVEINIHHIDSLDSMLSEIRYWTVIYDEESSDDDSSDN